MQAILAILSLLTIATAREAQVPALFPRQIVSNTTIASTQTNLVENPQTSFGAAAAQIQSAIAAGLQNSQSLVATTTQNVLVTSQSTIASSPLVTDTPSVTQEAQSTIIAPPKTLIRPVITTTAQAITITQPLASFTPQSAAPTSSVDAATVGSQGTTTVDGSLYTTTVVAAYVTVAAAPTTFYENGIAYVASYAGQTISVSDCPCTRSAKIVFSTTTVCNACVSGTPVPASATTTGGASVATVNGMPVVFTGASGSSTVHVPIVIASVLSLVASFLVL